MAWRVLLLAVLLAVLLASPVPAQVPIVTSVQPTVIYFAVTEATPIEIRGSQFLQNDVDFPKCVLNDTSVNSAITVDTTSVTTAAVTCDVPAGYAVDTRLDVYVTNGGTNITLADTIVMVSNVTCSPACRNGGVCQPSGECDCPAGFLGASCSIDTTKEVPTGDAPLDPTILYSIGAGVGGIALGAGVGYAMYRATAGPSTGASKKRGGDFDDEEEASGTRALFDPDKKPSKSALKQRRLSMGSTGSNASSKGGNDRRASGGKRKKNKRDSSGAVDVSAAAYGSLAFEVADD